MFRSVPAAAVAFGLLLSLASQAGAQEVPSSTGGVTSAPSTVTHGGATVQTAPAARTKARAHRRNRGGNGGTASTGANGADAMTGAGSAAPGGPGSPPPILPVGPGTAPMSRPGEGPSRLLDISYSRT